jgi:serine/threonine-protein kinase PpkA
MPDLKKVFIIDSDNLNTYYIVVVLWILKVNILMRFLGYNVGNVIGQGGMATVYYAKHILLNQGRALKVMSPELTNQPGFKESFISEGQFIATLKHPNIVNIYDISVQDGIYFMAMEYLQGGSLSEKLPLSLEDAIRVLKQIGSALYYAHQKKIIHRDIKPANILFNNQGDAILTDFGISKLEDTESQLTKMGYGIVGTVRYMSPEQTGGEKLDQRSDLYSLALVFYEMLSGEKAIKSNTHASIIREHAVSPPPTLPDEFSFLQSVLNKALAKTVTRRYSDIRAFVEAISFEKEKHDIKRKKKQHQRILLMKTMAILVFVLMLVVIFFINIEGKKEKIILPTGLDENLPQLKVELTEKILMSGSEKKLEKEIVFLERVNVKNNKEQEQEQEQEIVNYKNIEIKYKTVRVSPYLFLYDQPSGRKIGRLRQGSLVKISAITTMPNGKKWSKIEINKQQFYVKTSQLK